MRVALRIVFRKSSRLTTYIDRTQAAEEEEAVIVFDETEVKEAYRLVEASDRLIHGAVNINEGYRLAVPTHKAYTEAIICGVLGEQKPKIHHPPGLSNVLLSACQIMFACFTLYFTPSDQIPRWGYAAYGLSVFPYALMSLMNILCAGFVGSYTCGHVLRTHILDEAVEKWPKKARARSSGHADDENRP